MSGLAGRPVRRRAAGVKDLASAMVKEFGDKDLLSYASAIAFQVLFALVPLALAALALMGFLGLEQVWEDRMAPEIQEQLPDDGFAVVDRTVAQILGEQRGLWLSFGLAFALWQMSGAIRAATSPLNQIYEVEEERPWLRRIVMSVLLAAAIAPCLGLALLGASLGSELVEPLGLGTLAGIGAFLVRWGLAIALMLAALWLLLHFAPATPRKARWVSAGSAIVVGTWVVASLGYGWYVQSIASYESVFAGLASVIVLMTYIYILSVAFLAGVQAEAVLQRQRR